MVLVERLSSSIVLFVIDYLVERFEMIDCIKYIINGLGLINHCNNHNPTTKNSSSR